ncbi:MULTISPECIES: phenylacetate--CoA ligase family protein [unclassified Bradyrhizobium]|uniref:phenylacetate--CoA ligase family protein n=1 Tax=unclassified Bradyrhizobium TaxID=2631580 RepID=UPI0023069938|nr:MULTISPECIES: hypothetical protein [unclassified Bradyrhizobium]MDA9451211.1 hypothetical protein [Bradyrhizobium sp. CCBAU 21360]MDA9457590.1 hypothetical protein [Bradyrhizobium sp. CCBAU 21359]
MTFPFNNTSAEHQQARSLERLLTFMQDVVFPYSPYYRRVMKERNLHPGDMKSYEDFRKIPITRKEDIVAHQDEFTVMPAFVEGEKRYDVEYLDPERLKRYRDASERSGLRDIFGLRPADVRLKEQFLKDWQPIHFQMSGGSTGKSITTGYTSTDMDLLARGAAWFFELSGLVQPEDKWLNILPAAPHLGIYAAMLVPLYGAQPNFNTFGGKVMPTERQIELAADGKYAHILCLPSYLSHWLRTAKRLVDAGTVPAMSHFRTAICVGEPMTDSYRNLLHRLFEEIGSPGVKILEGMSSTELRSTGFYECAEGSKLHFDPEYFFAEILDPHTLEPVPWGTPGAFVWSHIDWHGTVILRYWTGDFVTGGMVWGDCPHCGRTIPRLVTPIWRIEKDFTKIRGARVEFVSLQDAVRGIAGVRTYQVIIRKEVSGDPTSRDRLDVHLAVGDDSNEQRVEEELRTAMKSALELTPDAIIFETATEIEAKLFAKKLKAEWVVDLRPTEVPAV